MNSIFENAERFVLTNLSAFFILIIFIFKIIYFKKVKR